ncbi:MAG: tripartite tricarboxylate transporter substrate binding protein, partial [Clostridium sp.]|nr:tripartite tricarboxylate transporter substrate binding protein [Clostridium sp.]
MKKRLFAMLLATAMMLGLASCGGTEEPAPADPDPAPSTSEPAPSEPAKDGWPEKAVTLLCGYSAGGSSDLGCRYLADALKEELG